MNKQRVLSFALAILLYVAVLASVLVYLLVHGENTVARRLQMTPHAEVSLLTDETAPVVDEETVPESWQDETAAVDGQDADAEEADADAEDKVVADVEDAAEPESEARDEAKESVEAAIDLDNQIIEDKVIDNQVIDRDGVTPLVAQKNEEASSSVTVNHDAVPVPVAQTQPAHVPVWKKNARPFNVHEKRPRIALVVTELGLARNASDAAVQDLPAEVTLAFSSLVPDLDGWFAKARAAGHELVLMVPMEPNNYPQNDPGPNALLLTQENAENVTRLQRALARGKNIVGVTPYMGDKFVTSEEKMSPVMQELRQKELVVLDHSLNGSSVIAPLARLGKMPFVRADLKIDAAANVSSIEAQLAKLEKIAKERGFAVGVALPYPVTFERLKLWIAQLDKKGLVLAPLSAVVTLEPSPVQVTDAPVAP